MKDDYNLREGGKERCSEEVMVGWYLMVKDASSVDEKGQPRPGII